jgi:hypothetical protein
MADRIAVANSSGVIVADTSGKLLGTIHPPRHLAHGVPVLSSFERVGTVLVGSMIDSGLSDLGSQFLESFKRLPALGDALLRPHRDPPGPGLLGAADPADSLAQRGGQEGCLRRPLGPRRPLRQGRALGAFRLIQRDGGRARRAGGGAKAAAQFAGALGDRKIEMRTESLGEGPFFVLADTLRFGEVLYNLLTNAVKHSPKGGTVRLRVSRRNADGAVLIAVDDQGPGVMEWERTRIFERFYRSDPSRARDSGGRGLGLAIASEIVKAHGGGIEVTGSDLGGASFALSLPAAD